MKKSIGFTQEQLLVFIKERIPKFVEVEIEEKDEFFSVSLKMETGRALSSGVRKTMYPDNLPDEERLLLKIKDRTGKEITELIHSFSTGLVESLIKSFNLEEFYRDKYEDKNVLYSVKKWWEKKELHGTWRTNFDNYYDGKADELIPARKSLWEALVKETVQHDNSKELIDYLFGAQERIKQLIFAADLINDIGSKNKADNDSEFAISFHVFHFISLVKSLSDNLAWIINLYCKMNLFEKRIDLVRKGFENRLKEVDKKLYLLIYDNPHFQSLVIIKSFRDITHHKHALHAETIKMGFEADALQKVMIPIDPKSGLLINGKRHLENISPKLSEASNKESIAEYGLKVLHVWVGSPMGMPWQEPEKFCNKFVNAIRVLYNSVYARIYLELTRKPLGKVVHYYPKVGVAIVLLCDSINLGDDIVVEGATTAINQKVTSLQIEYKPVQNASSGESIGLKTSSVVRINDIVYKMTS